MTDQLAKLRETLGRLEWRSLSVPAAGPVSFGCEDIDQALNGGLQRGAVHEILPQSQGDGGAASGFMLGLVARALQKGQSLVWIRQHVAMLELGRIYAPGLLPFGLEPSRLVLVHLKDGAAVMKAALEASGSSAPGAVVIESWGDGAFFDLTASRRLALAAEKSGMPVFYLRAGAEPKPSAAATRWRVTSMSSESPGAHAPGQPRFEIELIRHRAGLEGRRWQVEWNNDRAGFDRAAPLSRPVVRLPARRAAPPAAEAFAKRA